MVVGRKGKGREENDRKLLHKILMDLTESSPTLHMFHLGIKELIYLQRETNPFKAVSPSFQPSLLWSLVLGTHILSPTSSCLT